MITVRPAEGEDIPWMLDQLRSFSDFFGTRLKLFPDMEFGYSFLGDLIEHQVVFVTENKGELTGFIAGLLHSHPYNPEITVLTELLWWVPVEHRGGRSGALLFNAFTDEGKRSADWTVMTLESKSPINPETLTKRGFRLQEQSYLLETQRPQTQGADSLVDFTPSGNDWMSFRRDLQRVYGENE